MLLIKLNLLGEKTENIRCILIDLRLEIPVKIIYKLKHKANILVSCD